MSTITIEIENADSIQLDLADLLCWWDGFKAGIKSESGFGNYPIADNGVQAAKILHCRIKDALNNLKQ